MLSLNGFAEEFADSVSSSFRLGRRNGLNNVDEPTILQRNGETAAAISPDSAEQDLRLGVQVPAPHPCATAKPLSLEERRLRRVSKDEGPSVATWFETALARLLTMRV
jgi:hypothetical protein